MITTDQLLIELYNNDLIKTNKDVPLRDKKILLSLSRQIMSGNFLTENQGKLLTKIFKENSNYLNSNHETLIDIVNNATWSRPFRVIDQIRKIYLDQSKENSIIVEFTYNKRLKQIISDLTKTVQGQLFSTNNKTYAIPLTEKNIVTVVDAFKRQNFDVDEKILNFYHEIQEILKTGTDQFNIWTLSNIKIKEALKVKVGEIDRKNLSQLYDRKNQYQYQIFDNFLPESLSEKIAARDSAKIWINPNSSSLSNIVSALKTLNRLPVLIVFSGYDSKDCAENLSKLEIALEQNELTSNVGIYFRFDNDSSDNTNFNNQITKLSYNKYLSSDSRIVGIANNKLPKFLLKSDWYPQSVISFSANFRNNKTSVYCDAVDLIIYYNDRQPLEGGIYAIM